MPEKDPIRPGQQTSIPASNYDVNKDLGRVIDRLNIVDAPTAPNLLFGSGIPTTSTGISKVNPLYAQYINILKNTPTNPLTQPYYTPLNKAERYSNNEFGGYHPFDANLENWYGENQSWLNQWGNRIGKFGIKAIGSFANSLMDIPNVVNAVGEGNLDKMWDNPVNTWASDLMEWSEKNMPNYQTNWESEHPFLNLIPFYGNSGNGWGKVVENLGFTIGAVGGAVLEDLAVGALTGGVGEIPLAAMQINKAVYGLGKLINAGENTLSALGKSIKNSDDIIRGLRGIDRFNYATRKGLWGANMITSGFGEAAFEGIESHKTLVKDLNQQFFEENGRLPTYEESQKIENTSRDAANARFLMNSALLAVTNSIQWGSLIKPFNVVKELAEEEAKAGVRIALKQGSRDVFEVIEPTSKLARFGNFAKNNKLTRAFVGSSSEGFEEGAQFAIQTGVEDYYKRKYNNESIDFTNNFISSFSTAMSKTLGSQEGWENIVYGLLGGAMFKGGEHLYYRARGMETPDYRKKVDSVVSALNTNSLSGIFENKYGEAIAASDIEADMTQAAKTGNLFQYQNYKHEQFVNFVYSGIKQNKFDARLDQLQELRKLDDAEFKKVFGIPATSESRKAATEYVNSLEENARHIKEVADRVNRTFINPFNYKGTGNYKNKQLAEEQAKINEQYIAYEQVKEQLTYSMSIAKNSADRIKSIHQQITSLQTVVSPQEVVKLSSQDGLKDLKGEYKEKVKTLTDSLKLAKDAKVQRDLDWYNKQIDSISNILAETDSTKQNTEYNKFLGEVFDKSLKDNNSYYEIYGSDAQKDSVKRPFPRDVLAQVIKYGNDVYYLQKRNDTAIKNYSALTTKGGFKSLFDEILEIRRRANERTVNVAPSTPQAQNPQAQAALNNAQAQNGQPAAQVPANATQPPQPIQSSAQNQAGQQGSLIEGTEQLPIDQQIRLNRILVDIVDGKIIEPNIAMNFLGFKSIDDLKFDNPNVDLKEYVKVKSAEGKNLYISLAIVNQARVIAAQGVSQAAEFTKESTEANPATNPLINPPAPIGQEALRTDDYLVKIFVPQDLKQAFNDAIFSGTKDQVKARLTITVRPLSPEFQTQYDQQRMQGSYTPIKGFPNVFVAKAPIDLSISYNGVEIGKIAYPERLLFQTGNQLVTIDKLSPQQYQQFTGRPAAQHAVDVDNYRRQVAFKNYLALRYRNNNLEPFTLSTQELEELLDVSITYGEYDFVSRDQDRPAFTELKRNTVSIPVVGGGAIDTMLILSVPKRFNADTMTRERTEFINTIYGQNFYNIPSNVIDESKIRELLNTDLDGILRIGTRYIGLVELPNGQIATVALRPKQMSESSKDELFNKIKERSEESAKANFVESTEQNADGVLLIGDQKVYYKLPSDESRKFNDDFNTEVNDKLFISDPNGKSWFTLSVNPIGAIRLEVYEPISKYREKLYIAPQRMSGINNFNDMLDVLNKEIEKKAKIDPQFASLRVNLSSSNFRENIADDGSIENAEQLGALLTASTTTEVFKNGTMRLQPNTGKVQAAWNDAGGIKAAKTQPEQQAQASRTQETEATTSPINPVEAQQELPAQDQITELFGPQQTFAETIKTSGLAGLQRISETGDPINQDDLAAAAAMETKPTSQEDLTQMEFETVKDALAAFDIGYTINPDGLVQFYNISTNQPIDLPGITPADLANQMNLKIRKQQKGNPNEGFDFKLAQNGQAELNRLIDIEGARTYIESILPSFIETKEINEVLDKLEEQGIKNAENTIWGAFHNGIVYLNKNAPDIGIEYHEAFHAVFNIVLPKEEREKLLSHAMQQQYFELKKQGKSIRQYIADMRERGFWKDLTEFEAIQKAGEEWMAEEFRSWKLKRKNAGPLQKLFDLIERFFKWLLRDGDDLKALFRRIDRGTYRYSNIAASNFVQETTDEYQNPEFKFMLVPARPGKIQVGNAEVPVKRSLDAKTSKQVIQNVAAYYTMYRKTSEFKNLSDDKMLDQILNDLKHLYTVDTPEHAGWTQEQKQQLAASDESFIYSDEKSRNIIKTGAKTYIDSVLYIEQFQEDELEEEEQDKGSPSTGYDNRSENIGGFSSLPGMMRQYMGFTTYTTQDKFGNATLRENIPIISTIDAVSAYYGILRATANITDPIRFFQRMIRFGDGNEQARHFIEKFISDTGLNTDTLFNENRLEALKNPALVEMVKKAFNKFRIDYIFTQHDIKKAVSETYLANRRNVENVQFDKWANTYIQGYAEYDEDSQRSIRQTIDSVRNRYFDERRSTKYDAEQLSIAVSEISNALKGIGIQISSEYIKYSLLAINAKKFDTLNETYKKQGSELQFDDPQNRFITKQDYQFVQVMKIADELSITKEFMDELSKSLAANANPYFREIKEVFTAATTTGEIIEEEQIIDTAMVTRLLNIGRGNSVFDESVGESSFTNAENKIVYAHQDGTYNVKYSYKLRDAAYRKQLRETGIREEASASTDAYDTEWLTNNYLLKSSDFEAVADNLLYQNIDGMRAVETNTLGRVITQEFRDQKEGVTYGGYSPREFIVNLMNMYISYAKVQKTSKGDVTTTPHLIRVLEASKTGAVVNLPINVDIFRGGTATDKTANILFEDVKKEFNRINRVQSEIGTITDNVVENYHTGSFEDNGFTVAKGYRGLKFTDNITSILSKSIVDRLEGKARTGQPISAEDEAQIKASIKENINAMVNNTISILVREGIIKVDDKGNYGNVLLYSGVTKEKRARGFWAGDEALNLKNVRNKTDLLDNLGQVIVNDYINTLAYNQILHGDSALSLKNDGGIDAVKRAKGDNAAIVSIRTDLIAPDLGITKSFTHSNVAIFKEPTSNSSSIDTKGIKVADAQMYTTVEGLRYTLWGLGKLTPRLAKVLDALERGDDVHKLLGENEKFYDGIFDKNNGILRWDEMTNSIKLVYKDGKTYFKMSVVVLQPNLTSYKNDKGEWAARPGWETLHNLRTKMQTGGVHFAAPESASKMMTLDVARTKDFSDLKGHLFDNTYFGLQTENPSNKLEITTPTQLLQLIDSEQNDETVVYFEGQNITVGELKSKYQDYVSQKVSNAFNIAKQEIFEIQDFNQELEKSISEGKVTPKLAKFQARALETLEASGADAQLLEFFSLDENGNPQYNLNLSSTKTKFQQLYLSYFSRGILSQKSPGYTVALFSGIDTRTIRRAKRIENGQVIEWEHVRRDAWDTNYRNIRNSQILSSRDQVTEAGQYFLDELQYNVPEYNEKGEITGYYSEIMLPAHFRELLGLNSGDEIPEAIAKMLGVRIPSQDKHSFMSLKMIDFLPANLGSTGMFPKELIALSGADFDIDKEFITRYDFYMIKDKNGRIVFKKYGDATTEAEKWYEYRRWMAENNKAVKSLAKDILAKDSRYINLIEQGEAIEDEDTADEMRAKRKNIRADLLDEAISAALKQLNLPSTSEELREASTNGREYNNGVLNNRILDAYIALLTNDGIRDIAKTPATLTALDQIQYEDDITLRDAEGNVIRSVFSKNVNYPVDSFGGKYHSFKNNTTGKNNIGIDVNANLIYSILNKGNVDIIEHITEDGVSNLFMFDGQTFRSFSGDREFNLNTRQFDGRRVNDILSTLITSATDEAKEQLNALYNLGVDALKVVNYLVSLKVPLKTALYLVNQPAIRNYLEIKAVKQNTLQTSEEEKVFKQAFRQEAIAKTEKEIKAYEKMTDNEIFSLFEREGRIEVKCD